MSRRSSRRDALARAEARRRARYLAQGRSPDEVGDDEDLEPSEEPRAAAPRADAPRARGNLLQRLFPTPPPLPGKPDPLAGFTYQGRLRGLAEALYLLRRHPLPWLVGGLVWALGRTLSDNSMTGVLASLVSFTALIGAGWVGWWRPWLAGLAAAIVGWIVFLGLLGALTVTGPAAGSPTPAASGTPLASVTLLPSATGAAPSPSTPASPTSTGSPTPGPSTTSPPTGTDIAVALAAQTAIQLALGAGAGWYGGYLRRRMVANTPARRARPRR